MLAIEDYRAEFENLKVLTIRELIANFGKTKNEAEKLIEKAEMYDSIIKSPLGLHDSPADWAVKVLTKNNDFEAIEKYFSMLC